MNSYGVNWHYETVFARGTFTGSTVQLRNRFASLFKTLNMRKEFFQKKYRLGFGGLRQDKMIRVFLKRFRYCTVELALTPGLFPEQNGSFDPVTF